MNLQENIQRIREMMIMNESKNWGSSNQKLKKTFKFKDFNDAIDFVNKVAKISEQQNHHPDIEIKYNKVNISITDHEKGGVSEKCYKFVKSVDKLKEPIIEGLHDTSWENNEGNKITLMDLLNATEDIPVEEFSVEELKPHLLTWDGDGDEVRKIESADLQYPILIFVNDDGEFISIIDGHHRAQKAVRKGLETIKAKVIPINSLPKNIRRVFSHMN
jgi:4a-hydroxytetrahydrobiopterin dehydratase